MKSIGIFDSGIGGITFLREAWQRLPAENFIYFADTENIPYGTKNPDHVRHLVNEAVAFLSRQNIKALVIACNTATSAAISELRQFYHFPILGMEPAIKPALDAAGQKRVLVFSTSLTSQSSKLRMLCKQLDRNQQVDTVPFDELVKSAEAFDFVSPEVKNIIREKLSSIDQDTYGAVVLGCTHFIFYRPLIEEILSSSVPVFDGNRGTLNNLVKTLHSEQTSAQGSRGQIVFYSSGLPESTEREQMLLKLVRE